MQNGETFDVDQEGQKVDNFSFSDTGPHKFGFQNLDVVQTLQFDCSVQFHAILCILCGDHKIHRGPHV